MFTNNIKNILKNNTSNILTAVGIVSFIGSTVAAIQATPKVMCVLVDEFGTIDIKNVEPKLLLKNTYKYYIPTMGLAIIGISSIVLANRVDAKQKAVLSSLYGLANTTLNQYKSAILEEVGKNKASKIKEIVSQNKIDNSPIPIEYNAEYADGLDLCYDSLSGRYFLSNIEHLRRAQNDANFEMINSYSISLNELYDCIGISTSMLGSMVGWNTDCPIEMVFDTTVHKESGKPVLVMDFMSLPKSLKEMKY